jgi:hypothetical protein
MPIWDKEDNNSVMNVFVWKRLLSPGALLSIIFFAVTTAAAGQQPVVNIAIENISIASITGDRVQLSANVSLLTSRVK